MSGFSIWPRVVKGAFVVYFAKDDSGKEDPSQTPTVIPFQYNPETIRRTVTLKGPDDKNGKGALVAGRRVQGFPDETINMTIDLDATDAIATLDPVATAGGLAPRLARLGGVH